MEREGRYIPSFVLDFPLRDPGNRIMRIVRPFLKTGMAVLDHGAGSGYYTVKLCRAVGPEGRVIALDPNPASVRSISRKIERLRLKNIEVIQESGANMKSLPNDYFDFVFSNLTVCCLRDHRSAISEILRTLKPGSDAFISVTKENRPSDGLSVTGTEWDAMLMGKEVISRGNTIISRWAVIRKPTFGTK
ncbi:MAG: class I SAM-dependent methyltransferase [Thermoplasmataceae archaeon]